MPTLQPAKLVARNVAAVRRFMDPARITHVVSIEPIVLGVDRAITTGLVLNELISNALKRNLPGHRRTEFSRAIST